MPFYEMHEDEIDDRFYSVEEINEKLLKYEEQKRDFMDEWYATSQLPPGVVTKKFNENVKLQYIVNYLDQLDLLVDHKFEFPDGSSIKAYTHPEKLYDGDGKFVEIELEISDEAFDKIEKLADEYGISFNAMVNKILVKRINDEKD